MARIAAVRDNPPPYQTMDPYPAAALRRSVVPKSYVARCHIRDDRNGQRIDPFAANGAVDSMSPACKLVRIHVMVHSSNDNDDLQNIDRELGLSGHMDDGIQRWMHRFATDGGRARNLDGPLFVSRHRLEPRREFLLAREIRISEGQAYYEFALNRGSLGPSAFLSIVRVAWNCVCGHLQAHCEVTTLTTETMSGYLGETCHFNGERYRRFYGTAYRATMRYAILSNKDVNVEKKVWINVTVRPKHATIATCLTTKHPFLCL